MKIKMEKYQLSLQQLKVDGLKTVKKYTIIKFLSSKIYYNL